MRIRKRTSHAKKIHIFVSNSPALQNSGVSAFCNHSFPCFDPMDGCKLSSDEVVARLLEMGFHNSAVRQAVNDVGPSFDGALDYLLNGSHEKLMAPSVTPTGDGITLGKRMSTSSQFIGPMRQSSIFDHFHSAGSTMPKRARTGTSSDLRLSGMNQSMETLPKAETLPFSGIQRVADVGSDWEERANTLLLKHFGYPSLKGFQKEALAAWVANQDCLVLAATGSGKSLCFQLPALLTRKVVVVISPLISLMHDQCLKLSKHGVSACFLGSGQPDSTVERKAMKGLHDIIYVCPETVLRLIKPLQGLAESRGIALFAIDEVHCVSKWGHDFRPDYRRLSVLRESFSASNLNFLQFDVPLMALTATATIQVREDILNSLRLSKGTKIVLTSFFRSNLRFSVKHSRTSSPSSYAKDFQDLINAYARKRKIDINKQNVISKESADCSVCSSDDVLSDADVSRSETNSDEDYCSDTDNDKVNTKGENGSTAPNQRKMSVDYLENEVDVFQNVDDCDVACGEFHGRSPCEEWDTCGSSKTIYPPDKLEKRSELQQESLDEGPTIIYVPTRKETLKIAKYLCGFGVKAAAYNASLPKSHLRQVHREFHDNTLQVVVATVAFGMGIDKLNVRRIVHYGWPQSLEAYYQEAGRAGRDEKLADCVLYANLSRVPTLLPGRRSEDQTNQAYKMLSDCFKYGMNTSYCRAKILVEYFGEDFSNEKCLLCDVCVYGPPAMENVKAEAKVFMEIIAAHHEQSNSLDCSYDEMNPDTNVLRSIQKPNLRMLISKIREQSQQYLATDQLWWRGLARILEDKGYIREGDEKTSAHIKFPTPTKLGLEFLQFEREQPFYVYPEADMLLSVKKQKSYSTFADWGKGWADPAIRRQRLESIRLDRKPGKQRKPRMRKSRKAKPDISTARGRIAAKLLKQKR